MARSSTEQFLDAVCDEIRWKRWRAPIRRELAAHLEDKIACLTARRGLPAEQAEQEAVRMMGNPAEIGAALDKQHRPWQFPLVLLATLALWSAIAYAAYLLLSGCLR